MELFIDHDYVRVLASQASGSANQLPTSDGQAGRGLVALSVVAVLKARICLRNRHGTGPKARLKVFSVREAWRKCIEPPLELGRPMEVVLTAVIGQALNAIRATVSNPIVAISKKACVS